MGIRPLWALRGVSGQLSFLHSQWTLFALVETASVDIRKSYPQAPSTGRSHPEGVHPQVIHRSATGLSTGHVADGALLRETVRPVDYKWGWCDRLQVVEGAR
ncbi:hypothetical protein GCM10023334_044820 [Nonomuraea thailandensis]